MVFVWGMAAGYVVGAIVYNAKDVLRVWREAKAKVNEARLRHGIEVERRWWRL